MNYIIEVEETVKLRHQIYVDIDTEDQIDDALGKVDDMCKSLDDFADQIGSVIQVLAINENYYEETDTIEYFDSYGED